MNIKFWISKDKFIVLKLNKTEADLLINVLHSAGRGAGANSHGLGNILMKLKIKQEKQK